jgi:hypothetical protein
MPNDRNLNDNLRDFRLMDMITNTLIVVGTSVVIYLFPSQAAEALQTFVEGPVTTISGALSSTDQSPASRNFANIDKIDPHLSNAAE